MIAALAAVAVVYTAVGASITYYVLTKRQRRREVSAAARLEAWERIARRHAVLREDAGRVAR